MMKLINVMWRQMFIHAKSINRLEPKLAFKFSHRPKMGNKVEMPSDAMEPNDARFAFPAFTSLNW